MSEVVSGVHRFEDGGVNWYVVDTGDGALMVDSGWPRSRDRVLAALHSIGASPSALHAVLLTHGHPDHLGTAAFLTREHGVPVFAGRDELPRVRGERPSTRHPSLAFYLWRPTTLRFIAGSLRRGVQTPEWVPEVQPVPAAGLVSVRAIATPGHTEGHTAYLLADRGVLFTGDALVTRNVLTGREGPQLHPAPFQVDARAARRTLAGLADVDARWILPGHGEPAEASPAPR